MTILIEKKTRKGNFKYANVIANQIRDTLLSKAHISVGEIPPVSFPCM